MTSTKSEMGNRSRELGKRVVKVIRKGDMGEEREVVNVRLRG